MKNIIKVFLQNKKLHLIIIIIAGLGFNYLLFQKEYPNKIDGDEILYHRVAKALLNGEDTYQSRAGETVDIGYLVTPGYPAFIAGNYLISGNKPISVYLMQFAFSLVALVLIYLMLSDLFSNRFISLLATLWILFYWPLWEFNYSLTMESISASLLILIIWFLYKYMRGQQIKQLFILSIVFSILVITNVRFIVHAFVLGIYFIFYLHKYKRKTYFKHLIAYSAIIILTVFAWHYRQYITYDQFVLFNPGRSGYIESSADKEQIKGKKPFPKYESYIKRFKSRNSDPQELQYILNKFTEKKYNELKEQYYSNQVARVYWVRLIAFWETIRLNFELAPDGGNRIRPPHSKERNITKGILLLPMFIFGIVGFMWAIKEKNHFIIILSLFILAHWLLHTYFHYNPRYRLTVIPIIFLIGWYGITNIYGKIRPVINKLNI